MSIPEPLFLVILLWITAFNSSVVQARVIRIEITGKESPTFQGKSFGKVGAYEKLRGKAYGEVDPRLPQNALITDIQFAPRNSRGMVEYSMDIYLLKPVKLNQGNQKLFVEIPNRGGKLFGGFNNSHGGNDPATADDVGEGFLMNNGYSIAWCGWDISVSPVNNNLTITVPVAKNPDGSDITGLSYEYISSDNPNIIKYGLAYPAASLDKSKAKLTFREHLNDPARIIPTSEWEYINDKEIRLLPAGTAFRQSAIYEFTYTAKNPLVAGLGLAATRDFVSFLKYAVQDDSGNPNPLAGGAKFTFSYTVSQPARYMNDFQTLGFNADEQGRRVIDGIENWLGGGSGVGINYRFAQTGRTERNRQNHLYPEAIFPFAYPVLMDPLSGKTAGRLARCTENNTCPKVFEINSSNEYWVKAASLLHTDMKGEDLQDPANVRFFLVSGTQHGTGNSKSTGINQQLQNPVNAEPVLRALFVALDEWVTKGIEPPVSNVPRRSQGTAAFANPVPRHITAIVPQKSLGWPEIPGVKYTGLITSRFYFDYGKSFSEGIVTQYPFLTEENPVYPVYPVFVSKVDQDGNEIAGIHLPPVAVPTATTTGWALRKAGFAENDGGEGSGQHIPFKVTKAERLSAGDPRLSLEERYLTHEAYVKAVTHSAKKLKAQRLLLEKDVQKYIDEAKAETQLK